MMQKLHSYYWCIVAEEEDLYSDYYFSDFVNHLKMLRKKNLRLRRLNVIDLCISLEATKCKKHTFWYDLVFLVIFLLEKCYSFFLMKMETDCRMCIIHNRDTFLSFECSCGFFFVKYGTCAALHSLYHNIAFTFDSLLFIFCGCHQWKLYVLYFDITGSSHLLRLLHVSFD
jgi:hypothetical protein